MTTWEDLERAAVMQGKRVRTATRMLQDVVYEHHRLVRNVSKKFAGLFPSDAELKAVDKALVALTKQKIATETSDAQLTQTYRVATRLLDRISRHEEMFSSPKATEFWESSFDIVASYRDRLEDLVFLRNQDHVRTAQNQVAEVVERLVESAFEKELEPISDVLSLAYNELEACDRTIEAAKTKKKKKKKKKVKEKKTLAPIENDPWMGKKKTFDSAYKKIEHASTQLSRILDKVDTASLVYGDVRYARDMVEKILAAMRRC